MANAAIGEVGGVVGADGNVADEVGHPVIDAVVPAQSGLGPGKFKVPNWDAVSQKKVRDALVVLGETLPDWRHAAGRRNEVDPVRHLNVTTTG